VLAEILTMAHVLTLLSHFQLINEIAHD
jgi:hypothetical protein